MVLNAFYWATWCIMVLSVEDETNAAAYHWDLIQGKCDMLQLCVENFGFS